MILQFLFFHILILSFFNPLMDILYPQPTFILFSYIQSLKLLFHLFSVTLSVFFSLFIFRVCNVLFLFTYIYLCCSSFPLFRHKIHPRRVDIAELNVDIGEFASLAVQLILLFSLHSPFLFSFPCSLFSCSSINSLSFCQCLWSRFHPSQATRSMERRPRWVTCLRIPCLSNNTRVHIYPR